jgi:hypothetical protein
MMDNIEWAETLPEGIRYMYEERAGIFQFDAGMDKEQAEARAREWIECMMQK